MLNILWYYWVADWATHNSLNDSVLLGCILKMILCTFENHLTWNNNNCRFVFWNFIFSHCYWFALCSKRPFDLKQSKNTLNNEKSCRGDFSFPSLWVVIFHFSLIPMSLEVLNASLYFRRKLTKMYLCKD